MAKKKIMVIDDEKDFLRITKLNLESTGDYEVVTFSDARDIASRVREHRPDLVLIDLLMPAVGGIDACRMLNEDSFGKGVPIIVLSALEKETDKLNAYKAGVVDYVTKPIEKGELIAKIEKALRLKGA